MELNPHLGCLKFIFRLRRWEERVGSQISFFWDVLKFRVKSCPFEKKTKKQNRK